MASDKSRASWYYLLIVIAILIIITIIKPAYFSEIYSFFISLIKKMILVFLIVFFLMALTNYIFEPKKLIKHIGKDSGIKGWVITILAGIISSGPIYMWYPLLADLKNKGMKISLIATFLYNRAIKIPLIPLMVLYFNFKYVLVLTIVMIIMSILCGILTEAIIKNKPNKEEK